MKRIYQILVLAILVILNTSCLKSGLDELETYNLNDITNVRFEYRWWNESEQRMRIIEMNVDKSIDKENKKYLVLLLYQKLPRHLRLISEVKYPSVHWLLM